MSGTHDTTDISEGSTAEDGADRLVPRTGDRIDRRDMTDRRDIAERMARDILRARRGGQIGPIDLTEYGWTPAQAMRFGPAARDMAIDVAFATNDAGSIA